MLLRVCAILFLVLTALPIEVRAQQRGSAIQFQIGRWDPTPYKPNGCRNSSWTSVGQIGFILRKDQPIPPFLAPYLKPGADLNEGWRWVHGRLCVLATPD